jgi:hypothetical protein
MADRAQVINDDALEDDWEVVRRNPYEADLPTTISLAEAVERICKAMVDYVAYTHGPPEDFKKKLYAKNHFPTFTIIPFYELTTKKHLWKAIVSFEDFGLDFKSAPADCCEAAVEELFEAVSKRFASEASRLKAQADADELKLNDARHQARVINRISTGMGSYNIRQPNLPLGDKVPS